jgi:hypothetical protein
MNAETEINETNVTFEPDETEDATFETVDIVRSLVEASGTTEWSPYAIHVIVNRTLQAVGIEKKIPPQMMYQYAKKGMLNGTKDTIRFTSEETVAFVTKYINKNTSK